MIDLNLFHDDPERIIKQLKRKDPSFDGEKLYRYYIGLKNLKIELDKLRQEKNELASQAKQGLTDQMRQKSLQLGQMIKEKESSLAELESDFNALYLTAPNIPFQDLPDGGKEANLVVREWGAKPVFNFEPLHHVALNEKLGWFDFKTAAKMTASNFAFYRGDGARLIYALGMLMLRNNIKHGFEVVLPPFFINEESLTISGNFPKFRDQVYHIDADALFLTPTSEVNIANMYRDHIFDEQELPLSFTAFTSCFRREAGTYGSAERGLIRIHQFEKVEVYVICEPGKSAAELERMIACAEDILKTLGLHYRVSLLAAQDCSFQSAKTYDIEVWLPGQKQYYEVSSASNCTDFQARRGLMRYKCEGKNRFVHTLNASSLALPRLMVALLEQYQQEDGTIALPEVLKKEGLWL
ncbi:serine--tRNA ligase [bacterium]|nr:MAG: serine--tRNA ligase [bacterium]QQR61982.1 MAG: serine--tRNA ligase [bacterium]QQR62425.1 MAG: serine--tRNA ligase [bacterium]